MTVGKLVGRVNGLAVIGSGAALSGIILPIEAQAIPSVGNSTITLTGKVSQDDRESAKNVIAVVENYFGVRVCKSADGIETGRNSVRGVSGAS